jgi:flagellar hook-length control protein FliK
MDLGTIASVIRRVGAANDARAGAERIVLNLRAMLPLLEGQGRLGAVPNQLVDDLRSIATSGDEAVLVLPPGAGAARIDAGLRQLVIPATLRDALLAVVDRTAANARTNAAPMTASPAATAIPAEAAATARAWAVSAQASAAAAIALAGSGSARTVGRSVENDRTPSPVSFSQPLIAAPEPAAPVKSIAERLRSTLERSGLFFESHLAQWTRGERSTDALRQELVQLQTRPADPLAVSIAPGAAQAARVAGQLEVLQQQSVVLQGAAWSGQPLSIEISRERLGDGGDAANEASSGVFNATLQLELPHLGTVVARLRLAGDTIAAAFESSRADAIDEALPEIREGLESHGLSPVLLRTVARVGEPS